MKQQEYHHKNGQDLDGLVRSAFEGSGKEGSNQSPRQPTKGVDEADNVGHIDIGDVGQPTTIFRQTLSGHRCCGRRER